jgi:hypothetical protein
MSYPTSTLYRVCNNQPKELVTSEVYHMVVTTSIEQSGWMTGEGWTKWHWDKFLSKYIGFPNWDSALQFVLSTL